MKTIIPAYLLRLLPAAFMTFCLSIFQAEGAVIWINPITGINPSSTNPFTSGQTVGNNLTVSGIGYSGVTASSGNGRFNTEGWNHSSCDTTKYIYLTLTTDPGYIIQFTSFTYNSQATGNGPTNIAIRSSLDCYASDIGTPGMSSGTIDLSGTSYQDFSGTITFRIYTWGASSAAGTFSIDNFTFNGTIEHPTVFYHNTGDLHVKTNWGNKPNGTGAKPADFVTDGQTFYLRNAATASTANWTVSGTGSKIIVPSGVTFTIAASHTVSGTIDAENGATVKVAWNFAPTFGTLSTGSTVDYCYAGSQDITAATYSNMTISAGGIKSLLGTTTVSSTLTFSSGYISLGSCNLVISSTGSISGASSSSYIIATGAGTLTQQVTAGSGKTFPTGTSADYLPATVALTGGSTTDNFSIRLAGQLRSQGTSGVSITQDVVNATWFISEGTAGGSSATITLQWPAVLEMSGFNRSACRLLHYTGGAWDYGSSDIVASGSNPYTASRSGITSFSPFGMGENTPLPVTWLDIYGENKGRNNTIYWSTASEWNNDYFEIQSSADGINFKAESTVKAIGNSNEVHTYQFTHEAMQSVTYYRIRQVDFDGKYEFGKMIIVKYSGAGIAVYTDPGNNCISIINAEEGSHNEILDINGKVYASATTGKSPVIMDTSMLPPGLYLVRNYNDQDAGGDRIIKYIK